VSLLTRNTRPRSSSRNSRSRDSSTSSDELSANNEYGSTTSEDPSPDSPIQKGSKAAKMDVIGKKLAVLDSRRQDLAKELDVAQKSSDYDNFQRLGNNYLGTILESIDLYIDLIREISSAPVAGELKNEFSEIVKKGRNTKEIEGQSEWISKDVSPLYEKVRQICACVYAAVAKIDQEANKIA
jgi:hypothetical protein